MTQINVRPEGSKGTLQLFGGCREFMDATEHQVVLFGSTNSGKTFACCYRLALRMIMYPGAKALMTRKSYTALVNTGVETWEKVLHLLGYKIGKKGGGPTSIYRLGESKPTEYVFPYAKREGVMDGKPHVFEGESRLVLASLSNVTDQLGAEYDYVYLNQPEDATEDDWQFLAGRCNGRRGHVPVPQLFGDPNPASMTHWLWKGGYGTNEKGERLGEGTRWRLIKSTYHDNPVAWDHKLNCFTKQGQEMYDRLMESYNPVMIKRLIEGEWCDYEGLAFAEVWNPRQHVINADQLAEYNVDNTWDRYWAIDFGFDDPFTWSEFAKCPYLVDGEELYINTKLIYMSQRTIIEQAASIRQATIGSPLPKLIVADRNPQEIAMLSQALGMNIVSAKKHSGTRIAKVDVIYEMLKKNQLKFYEDALVEVDKRLLRDKRPIGFIQEVGNLRWKENHINEDLVDGDDHQFDGMAYLFLQLKADQKVVPFIWV
jgi:hypothetical protein